MLKKLNAREKRTVLFCAVGSALVLGYVATEPLLSNWKAMRGRLAVLRTQARQMALDPRGAEAIELDRLIQAVPVIAMPEGKEARGPVFQEEFTRQLRQAGLNSRRLQLSEATGSGARAGGYRVLRLESQGRGNYDQLLRLFSSLPTNPMYAGVQRLRLQADAQNRQQMDWELTVFTYDR